MLAVGVDVSNGKSTVAILRSKTNAVCKPFDVKNTADGLADLVAKLNTIEGEKKIVMEHTGRYYEPVAMYLDQAGFFVSALNPLLINEYQDGIVLRKVKTDKADSVKIARFALDNWDVLRQYTPMDTIRYQLKTLNRQFQLSSKTRTAYVNNLIALLSQSYPGLRSLFDSPVRPDGSQKWVDYANTFWHVDCVRKISMNTFKERYYKWCKRHGYQFSDSKVCELYEQAKGKIALVPKTDISKMMVQEAIAQLNAISHTVEVYRAEMNRLASLLPEYEAVMAMYGVGGSLGPQLMAEIGDLRRFRCQKSLVAFAGTDPGKKESGDKVAKSGRSSKRGSSQLRRTLFVIMTILMKNQPVDEPVYQFIDRKRCEGKGYYVYMTAGMTKFLRIYYGRVRDNLREKGLWESP